MNVSFSRTSGLALAGLVLAMSSHAATWNANTDFTSLSTQNPNGVWTYGYDPADLAGYQLKPFDTFRIEALTLWTDSTY